MQNLYNIVAELCASIVNSCSEEFFVRYSCVSPAEKRRIYKEVQASVGTLFLAKPEGNLETPDDESIRELVPADLTDSFYANLQALIGRFTNFGSVHGSVIERGYRRIRTGKFFDSPEYEPRIGGRWNFAALLVYLGTQASPGAPLQQS